jgi:adenosylmethionine-8-amino-7-oxononanoate aminotransferase
MGKGITGGYLPLSAVAANRRVFEAFLGPDLSELTFYHGHSYSGNALACAVALRHLQLLDDWEVLANVQDRAAQLGAGLRAEIEPLDGVAAVRRHGLMVGVELDPPGTRPEGGPSGSALRWGRRVCAAAVARGVLLRPLADVVVLMPMLTSTATEIDHLVAVLAQSITQIVAETAGGAPA